MNIRLVVTVVVSMPSHNFSLDSIWKLKKHLAECNIKSILDV